jgi:uracil-DNA glycosylase
MSDESKEEIVKPDPIEDLIAELWDYESECVFNPWAQTDPLDLVTIGESAPYKRRERLRKHMNRDARFLLIGEAPGYQGCHFSGVPFTSEALLCAGAVPGLGRCDRLTSRERPWSEPSATIIWAELRYLGIAHETVMWNAFAFHPHKPSEPYSNRAPTAREIKDQAGVLDLVIARHPKARIIAVGRVAERTLAALDVTVDACLRHPSMGGANQFREGLREIVRRYQVAA